VGGGAFGREKEEGDELDFTVQTCRFEPLIKHLKEEKFIISIKDFNDLKFKICLMSCHSDKKKKQLTIEGKN
jgi:hypothetical protein